MNEHGIDACWNRIGVHGDQSCTRLAEHGHCRRCEIFADAARRAMHREIPPGYRRTWAAQFAVPSSTVVPQAGRRRAMLVFRLAQEWLGLPAASVECVTEPVEALRLPHRPGPVLLGIAAIRSKLHPCMSLAALLGIEGAAPARGAGLRVHACTLLLRLARATVAVPVHEVLGVVRLNDEDLEPPPTSLDLDAPSCIVGVFSHEDKRIGCLDADLLARNLERQLQ
ncbi:MAG TPA: chemotaxis protein CheW [Noviherbaspirillum sp.]|nr:chemotaxis protein CheW [Noviherbaspirillum sp.]